MTRSVFSKLAVWVAVKSPLKGPFPFQPTHADELARLTGIERDRFEIVDGEMLSWHGSRTPAGIDYAEQVVERARARRQPR